MRTGWRRLWWRPRHLTIVQNDEVRCQKPLSSWVILDGAPSPSRALISYLVVVYMTLKICPFVSCFGAIVSFVVSLAFETPRCHFTVLASMIEIVAIKALGSARSPTKQDDFHSEVN
ncbi:hypothetical protein TNCV_810051 [Trichonephila clavipes]|uniref:Uncharacterized protein n=1 Tax=Trichonephila clavipes TaxID=2585209 RepID=A0A8X6V889_TRICX|nr:hypothetical protein TNCV_810051 [Trichonephila clavipes]